LEIKVYGLEDTKNSEILKNLEHALKFPGAERIFAVKYALQIGMSLDEIYAMTGIDRWFLSNMKELVDFEKKLKAYLNKKSIPVDLLREAKALGFSDRQLAGFWGMTENQVFKLRHKHKVMPEFQQVDTCAAEFEAYTPYFYSTYS
ncbi:MAG: carbamoyl phosphate synthase large subunit, partial [Candidatus Margulisbacteria bacterium]|nr:carbamoyl phosphate synthase large subunit [Candidatus Margulisiibacteriota bacterium]